MELRYAAPPVPWAPPIEYSIVALLRNYELVNALEQSGLGAEFVRVIRDLDTFVAYRGDETAVIVDWLPWLREARAELGPRWRHRTVYAFGPDDADFHREAGALGVDEVIHAPRIWVDPGASYDQEALADQLVLFRGALFDWLRRHLLHSQRGRFP